MTPRQIAFAEQYVTDHNGAGAAVRAGYAANSARVTASQLLAKANVRALVAEHEAAAAQKLELDRERVLAGLVEAVDVARAQGDPGAMIRAWAEIGKLIGAYAQERAIKVDISVTTKRFVDQLETLADADLLELVAGEGTPANLSNLSDRFSQFGFVSVARA